MMAGWMGLTGTIDKEEMSLSLGKEEKWNDGRRKRRTGWCLVAAANVSSASSSANPLRALACLLVDVRASTPGCTETSKFWNLILSFH
jgi:hypothetical protein